MLLGKFFCPSIKNEIASTIPSFSTSISFAVIPVCSICLLICRTVLLINSVSLFKDSDESLYPIVFVALYFK